MTDYDFVTTRSVRAPPPPPSESPPRTPPPTSTPPPRLVPSLRPPLPSVCHGDASMFQLGLGEFMVPVPPLLCQYMVRVPPLPGVCHGDASLFQLPRRQAWDGIWYTQADFQEYYGERRGNEYWRNAFVSVYSGHREASGALHSELMDF